MTKKAIDGILIAAIISFTLIYKHKTVMEQPIRVLIADDSAPARNGLRALLATWSHISVVGEAINGHEAVQLVAECQPDAVLMDLHMPVLDGVQATRLIKQQWPMITVIVLTMYAAQEAVALEAGADAFVVKGSTPERLIAALSLSEAL